MRSAQKTIVKEKSSNKIAATVKETNKVSQRKRVNQQEKKLCKGPVCEGVLVGCALGRFPFLSSIGTETGRTDL